MLAKFKKPIILSTGNESNLQSISKSVDIIKKQKTPLILMHTTNSYPCT